MTLKSSHAGTQNQTNVEYSRQKMSMFLESDILPSSLYYSEKTPQIRPLYICGSTVMTADLGSKLCGELVRSNQTAVTAPIIKISEVEELEDLVKKITAVESVSGLLCDLTIDQMSAFDNAVQRRPWFENE